MLFGRNMASLPRWPRLAKYFGTSEHFWLNLQDAYAVRQVKEKYAKELKAVKPLAAAASR
jgi:plasmid maintenance system antidote protein VapI